MAPRKATTKPDKPPAAPTRARLFRVAKDKTAIAANVAKKRAEKMTATTSNTTKSKTLAAAKKARAKKPKATPAKKTATTSKKTATASKKRKVEDDADDHKPVKKSATAKNAVKKEPVKKRIAKKRTTKPKTPAVPKPLVRGPVVSEAPTAHLEVLVCGEGSAGELGLGSAKNVIDVRRPRVNNALSGCVQVSAGGMHGIAITATNEIITWGVNDTGALGRQTVFPVPEDDDSDAESDSGLNRHESTPTVVDWTDTPLAEGTRWAKVVAGDTCTFAVTEDGKVYGCGEFRCNEGPIGFTPSVERAHRFMLIEGLKDIVDVVCGANHALALDNKGRVFAWGSGDVSQLGRRTLDRKKLATLIPREVCFPKAAKKQIKKIASGAYHSFAITNDDRLYAWGLNATGQTGVNTGNSGQAGDVVPTAHIADFLGDRRVLEVAGGSHHSIIITESGEVQTWGRCDAGALGLTTQDLAQEEVQPALVKRDNGNNGALLVPVRCSRIPGRGVSVSAGPEHTLAVTADGRAYSVGFSANYQTGQGMPDDFDEFEHIDNTACRSRHLTGCNAGGQYSIFTARQQQQVNNNAPPIFPVLSTA